MAGLKLLGQHNFRESQVSHADPERREKNELWLFENGKIKRFKKAYENLSDGLMKKAKAIIEPLRKRKDSVHGLDYVVGIPKEVKGIKKEAALMVFEDSLKFLLKKHGQKNFLYATIHDDESGIHMHAEFIPVGITRDKHGHEYETLTARPYTGGRTVLRQLQTDYHEQVGKPLGFERGLDGSKAEHEKPADYRRRLAREKNEIDRLSEENRKLKEMLKEPIRLDFLKKTKQKERDSGIDSGY